MKLHKLKFPMLMIIMCGILHGILLDTFCAGELYLALCYSILWYIMDFFLSLSFLDAQCSKASVIVFHFHIPVFLLILNHVTVYFSNSRSKILYSEGIWKETPMAIRFFQYMDRELNFHILLNLLVLMLIMLYNFCTQNSDILVAVLLNGGAMADFLLTLRQFLMGDPLWLCHRPQWHVYMA